MRRLELTIERMSKSGDGVAQVDGRAVFVAGGIPGERVLAEVVEEGKALRGELLEVLTPSPARRTPVCPLAGACGGCDWMHLDEASQLEHKQVIVTSSLEHVGKLAPGSYELRPAVESPRAMAYRRRAVLHPVNGRLGYFGRGSHFRVEVSRCPALTAELQDLPGRLADALGNALKDVDEVHLLEAGGKTAISLHLKGTTRPKHREVLEALVRQRLVTGAVVVPEGKGTTESFGVPALEEGGVFLRPDGFSQANAEVNRALVTTAVDLLGLEGAERVLELYSGNGNFTFEIAGRLTSPGQVIAVESAPVGVLLAQQSSQRKNPAASTLRFVQGDAGKIADGFMKESARFDRLLLDPPRTGAPGIGTWASRLLVSKVVYVACDPVSLARDAADLWEKGFRPQVLQLFDLFPQTHHVEAVMSFAR